MELQPLVTTGDGNCLFNALPIALCGLHFTGVPLRTKKSLLDCATPGAYSNPWTIQAAADAIGRNIRGVYPFVKG
ncbi:hypothetical protein DPMN_051206 [Dreissena polymorpha]|uniref:OTU domain-containing protein n=1 Tax=Dreissena polymorpha TaxID=45954 RepID=A0A9D4CHG8_DREPO|nr:hypothetical protein DPMN_051206 [Dreissena polymorpha]